MPWRLVPLHSPSEPSLPLPKEGAASVGRRPTNTVVCRDLAVSGQHCILHCRGGGIAEPPELEDCSTNGSYVNDSRLQKGQRMRLSDGDVIALTKPVEEVGGTDQPPRVQFRLEFRDGELPEGTAIELSLPAQQPNQLQVPLTAPERHHSPADLPPTPAPSPAAPAAEAPVAAGLGPTALPPAPAAQGQAGAAPGGVEHSFAQDLLVQEQQSKAKITSELLIAQRKLEEERVSADSMSRELRKIRQQVEEERSRRHEAEEARDRLTSEAELLRAERRQLKELTAAHEELRSRHEAAKTELQARVRRCQQLEAAQEQLHHELEKASETSQKAAQQHAEVSTRARQAQERSERLEQQHVEAQRDADRALEEGARLQRQLAAEVSARQKLDDEVTACKDLVVRAEASERAAREALDAATARRAELECQASSAHSDAEAAKAAARQAQQRLSGTLRHGELLREAGQSLSAELRRRAGLWERALAEGNFEGLVEALAGQEVPTFEAVTCRNEDQTPTRTPNPEEIAQSAAPAAAAVGAAQAAVATANVAAPAPVATDVVVPSGLPPPVVPTAAVTSPPAPAAVGIAGIPVEPEPGKPVAPVSPAADARDAPTAGQRDRTTVGAGRFEELDDDDDGLLAAVSREPAPKRPAEPVPKPSAAGGGCSTAWSLELMDVVDPLLGSAAPCTALDEQPLKRPRLAA